ncbi:MAG: HDIG domain-containing protein [Desulfobacteraceae bacterium]|nr:MAG: HDIG domain-containing protein [Desulfobacteraceae bacterium]
MQLPTRAECFDLMRKMDMMDHIRDHSVQVCRVAIALASPLQNDPNPPDLRLLEAATLLHDITKTRAFETGENHAATGAQLLIELGFPEVGHVVRQHVQLDSYLLTGVLTEAEITNYSDKRVLHDQVVPLSQRMVYIMDRYGKTEANRNRISSLWEKTKALEERIFKRLPFQPEELSQRILDF